MDNCQHLNIIDDLSSGDTICKDCGLIVDKIYLSQNIEIFKKNNNFK